MEAQERDVGWVACRRGETRIGRRSRFGHQRYCRSARWTLGSRGRLLRRLTRGLWSGRMDRGGEPIAASDGAAARGCRPGSRPVSRDGPPPLSSLPVNERARAMEAWAHLMGRADPCVTVRQKALESKRWFDLSVQPEGPRKLAPPLLPLDNQRPSTSDGSFGAGFVEHEMAPRPMSSYSNACLQVSRGGAHPMLYEEPWHRPQSAGHRQLPATSLLTESSLASDPGEPLGVEPIIFTNRMDKWFGKRAMLSPGRRGRPRAMPT